MGVCSAGDDRSVNQQVMNESILIERACRVCGVSREEMLSSSRKRNAVVARQMLCYALREKGYVWQMCGRVINRDHATAMYGARMFEVQLLIGDKLIMYAWRLFTDDSIVIS